MCKISILNPHHRLSCRGADTAYAQDAALNAANTAWMLTSTVLVLFMTLPGLALFYGGLVRSKNILSVLMQCFSIACIMSSSARLKLTTL